MEVEESSSPSATRVTRFWQVRKFNKISRFDGFDDRWCLDDPNDYSTPITRSGCLEFSGGRLSYASVLVGINEDAKPADVVKAFYAMLNKATGKEWKSVRINSYPILTEHVTSRTILIALPDRYVELETSDNDAGKMHRSSVWLTEEIGEEQRQK